MSPSEYEEPQVPATGWLPQPRESILSEVKNSKFKHQKIEQLVDLFAVPDQVAPTFQRILFDRLVNNFKVHFVTYQSSSGRKL